MGGGAGGGCQPTVSRPFGVTPPPSVAGLLPCGPPGGGRVEEVYRGYLGGKGGGVWALGCEHTCVLAHLRGTQGSFCF